MRPEVERMRLEYTHKAKHDGEQIDRETEQMKIERIKVEYAIRAKQSSKEAELKAEQAKF
eukprot:CAMPEP_0185594916 /NCGR_PEP_ID=MMETSP0434-20130131/76550_1 /TAXON_ID=626734 ORGANISM="Favella taraikaensis, Strain Fe Narragansett Bay" /NCGR_SAMPLE_ID=MMETSP0434 /ASSEMBLY_ACC=CAM_ASM_000379 /LENGTH=59 /DNA_ID=CAMNT_0028222553 /DNA_START=168 /DNA_END=347 /DNA_ORIENTATION=+